MPMTTIPPFNDINKLPACAVGCDALYAANAPCVPPEVPETAASIYTNCFCSQGPVAPFATGSVGVCDEACTADSELSSIASWYRGICKVGSSNGNGNGGSGGNGGNDDNGNGGNGNNGGGSDTKTLSDGSQETSLSGSSSGGGGGGGDW